MIEQKQHPELVIGLVGPIGSNIDAVQKALVDALKEVDYKTHEISLSASIGDLLELLDGERPDLKTLAEKIDAGNQVRQRFEKNGILAVDAIRKIRQRREQEHRERKTDIPETHWDDEQIEFQDLPAEHTAYIVRQLKRKEEVDLLEKVYGKQFLQVSVTQEKSSRINSLVHRASHEQPSLTIEQREEQARDLVKRDENEIENPDGTSNIYGQRLADIFHLGDVFVETESAERIALTCRRFVRAVFGQNDIAPTRDEFGSYLAKSASLRSVDTSRQVGSAIISEEGDLITIGCNEVPKPLGGNYWDEDEPKARDVDKKLEANKVETNRIIFDFLRALHKSGILQKDQTPEKVLQNADASKAIGASLIGDITEYGRMVHAEMNAISDAARLGRSVRGSTLYVTTFPCHNCAKHIIASGIKRVVYIEPYPKSRTDLLYSDAIASSQNDSSGVHLSHFAGISPRRYRDIFEKGKRRDKSGAVEIWYQGQCKPRLGHRETDYTLSEKESIVDNLGQMVPEEEA